MIRLTSRGDLARALSQLREAAGMSREGMAKRLHVSVATIGFRENNQSGWCTEDAIAAANALGYDLALILREPTRPGPLDAIEVAREVKTWHRARPVHGDIEFEDEALIPREDA